MVGDSSVPVIVGVVLAIVFIVGVAAGTFFFFRNRHLIGLKLADRPVFSARNPNGDTLQIIANEVTSESTAVDPHAQAAVWKQSVQQQQQAPEPAPSAREEFRLGAVGAGFKRFK